MMAYWHRDERGDWYFDWSHLTVPLVLAFGVLIHYVLVWCGYAR